MKLKLSSFVFLVLALFASPSQAQDWHVMGGLTSISSLDSGIYLGLGKTLGSARQTMNWNTDGQVAVEGIYSNSSQRVWGYRYSDFSLAGVYSQNFPQQNRLGFLLYAGLGHLNAYRDDGRFDDRYISGFHLVGGGGFYYALQKNLKAELRLGLLGYDGLKAGLNYNF